MNGSDVLFGSKSCESGGAWHTMASLVKTGHWRTSMTCPLAVRWKTVFFTCLLAATSANARRGGSYTDYSDAYANAGRALLYIILGVMVVSLVFGVVKTLW